MMNHCDGLLCCVVMVMCCVLLSEGVCPYLLNFWG